MAGSKILVVDEDLASRNYLAATLRNEGYEVLTAASGKEGLISAWRDHPQLVIADPAISDLAGEELASRLRADGRTADVPLVALSSDAKPIRRQQCLQSGFKEYLLKSPEAMLPRTQMAEIPSIPPK